MLNAVSRYVELASALIHGIMVDQVAETVLYIYRSATGLDPFF